MPSYDTVIIDGWEYMPLYSEWKYDMSHEVSRKTRGKIQRAVSCLVYRHHLKDRRCRSVWIKKEYKVADFVKAHLIPFDIWNSFIRQSVGDDTETLGTGPGTCVDLS